MSPRSTRRGAGNRAGHGSARGNYWGETVADAAGADAFGVEHVPFGASKAIAVLPLSARQKLEPSGEPCHCGG